jgi:hypothetical protein
MENNIKLILKAGCKGMDWNHLTQDRAQWRALVSMAINLRVSYYGSISWPAERLLAYQRRLCFSKLVMVNEIKKATMIYKGKILTLHSRLSCWSLNKITWRDKRIALRYLAGIKCDPAQQCPCPESTFKTEGIHTVCIVSSLANKIVV